MAASGLWQELAPRQRAVEAALLAAVGRHTATAPPQLAEALRYTLMGPGKRVRPLLCVLACEAAGGSIAAAEPAACALEMVHTYSLVHDDLPAMDDDDLRRGRPTCHKVFGEAMGILAGDALLTLAFEVLAAGCPPAVAAVSCAELAAGAGAVGMVGGQVLDLQADGKIPTAAAPASAEDLENIHRRKTGALFRSAVRLGLIAANATAEQRAAGDEYSAAFGLAFQVTDDLLDAGGSAEQAGKRVGKDAARGKLTYPGLLGVDASRRKAAELVVAADAAAVRLGGDGGRLLAGLARFLLDRER